MGKFIIDLLLVAAKRFGKLMDKFFKSARGKRVKGWLPEAAAAIGMVAARTENTVDDAVAKIATEMGLSGSPGELLAGKMGDWLKREAAKRILQDRTKATDSEANLAVEIAYNQMKDAQTG